LRSAGNINLYGDVTRLRLACGLASEGRVSNGLAEGRW